MVPPHISFGSPGHDESQFFDLPYLPKEFEHQQSELENFLNL